VLGGIYSCGYESRYKCVGGGRGDCEVKVPSPVIKVFGLPGQHRRLSCNSLFVGVFGVGVPVDEYS